MKSLSKTHVLDTLHATHAAGQHVDQSIFNTCQDSEIFYEVTITDFDALDTLAMPHITGFDFLFAKSDRHKKHSIKHIAQAIVEQYDTLDQFIASLDDNNDLKRWMKACVPINNNFDIKRLSWPILIPINDHERKQAPNGIFRLYNGLHRLLVYSIKVIKEEIEPQPINCLFVGPRREGFARLKRDWARKRQKWLGR